MQSRRMALPRYLFITLAAAQAVHAQEVDIANLLGTEKISAEQGVDFINRTLPESFQLEYLENDDSGERSLGIRYDWSSQQDWETNIQRDNGQLLIRGSKYNVFADGYYAFQDEVSSTEKSQAGVSYKFRYMPISFTPLTAQQSANVQNCIIRENDAAIGFEQCRAIEGYDHTNLNYQYFDIDFHAKMEGDQTFDQRNYAYGFELSYARNFGTQKYLLDPILTLGLEQIDPVKDVMRQAVLAGNETYDRAYVEFSFTGNLGKIRGKSVRLNYSWRYFRELSPDQLIEDAGLDRHRYSVVALEVPTSIIPMIVSDENSFVLSYASGSLPFSLQSEQTFAIGWKTNIDFEEILGMSQ